MRLLIITVLIALFTVSLHAQQRKARSTVKDYARKPLWIGMMDDTTANFYEVEKAYDVYFQHHEKPEGEEAEINEQREREKIPSRRKQRRIQAENQLRMAVKHYEVWHYQTLPYVRDDGYILTPAERLAIHRAQMQSK
jgi:hypothetical protein